MGLTRRVKRLVRAHRERRALAAVARDVRDANRTAAPAHVDPIWPLPRADPRAEVDLQAFDRFAEWHYPIEFEGGPKLGVRYTAPPFFPARRPFQRFAHFMPALCEAVGGLRGKRVLDVACNAGFWSFQCALLGAREVVGFDARPDLVEHAELVRRIAGIRNVRFEQLDFWSMSPATLGTFDVVLSLGILYHLADPLAALERTAGMASQAMLLDTAIDPSDAPIMRVKWEEPSDVRNAARAGIVVRPSRTSVELMLDHLGLRSHARIPLRSLDVPPDYLHRARASWIVKLG
jgi:2-polyprenyl-3-methyl-5-hydroxy-6-metoxy-1,4-benzoquinol methylase